MKGLDAFEKLEEARNSEKNISELKEQFSILLECANSMLSRVPEEEYKTFAFIQCNQIGVKISDKEGYYIYYLPISSDEIHLCDANEQEKQLLNECKQFLRERYGFPLKMAWINFKVTKVELVYDYEEELNKEKWDCLEEHLKRAFPDIKTNFSES